MALKLQFAFNEGPTLEAIVMDATLSEGHNFTADVTDFPVEKGSAVTDNVRPKPTNLRVDAFISDFPLPSNIVQQLAAGAFTQKPTADLRRSQNALDKLIQLKDQGVTITVTTGIRTYQNMVIQSIDVNRDKMIAQGIRMMILMREIAVVSTQTVQIVAAERKGENKQANGPKTAKENDDPQGSLAAKVFDSFGGGKVLPQ
jgi:hypothetical protein